MKQYGVTFKTKNGRYSEIVLTMVIEANNKEEAKEDAIQQILGNKFKDIFPKETGLQTETIFDRDTARCFFISAHKFQ